MEDQNSDDFLPPGWTVQVRVRKDGRRDKYYFAPASGLRFSSRLEVSRYLKNAENQNGSIEKIAKEGSTEKIVKNVVIEKGIAEGLPPGWIRKTRVTEKGDKTRRDSYYIDPVSGYAFRSLKDVNRYLQSGKIGRNAFKPKADDGNDMVSSVRESAPLSERCSGLEQKEEMVDFMESASISICEDGVAPEKQLPEIAETKNETDKTQNRKGKQKRKKETNLPRRASKRLAGIKADPVPELVKFNRSRQVAVVKQSGEKETIKCEDDPHVTLIDGQAKHLLEGKSEAMPPKSVQSKHSYGNLPTPEKLPEKIVGLGGRKSDEDKSCISALPQENQTYLKDHVRDLEDGSKVDMKDYALGLPLGELLTDPCIAFAIQILTGIPIETAKNSHISSDSNNSKHFETLAEAKDHGRKIKGQNMVDKTNENLGSSSELQFGPSWMDPCIDFAIKTLTGAIPVDTDQNIGKYPQQPLPLSSSNTGRHCEMSRMSVSDINMNNSCQNDYYCSQYFNMQKPLYGQQPFMKPALPNTRNVGVGSSVGVRLPQCGEDRKNGWQR